ncbi:site-specific integrase [Ruminococcaceae bacterium OttesenSCG-928-I18]|nr:site-specific integrase [Ruminococcaceae bacterium OttesenSCG-928-I18]
MIFWITAKRCTQEQVKKVLDAAKGNLCEVPIFIEEYYGTRRSEAIGLKWNAIDFAAKTITIRHTVTVCSNGSLVKADITKTKKSYRTLPLIQNFEEYLLEVKEKQDALRELIGPSYNPEGYVCVRDDGRLIHPDRVTYHYKQIVKKAGVPPNRNHDSRHSNASTLVKNHINMKEIQRWLGHSDIKTTGNLYSHLETADLVEASQRIENSYKNSERNEAS